ncbi:MAG TPA: D-2-hydroxyacid dehydrogenase [Caulobacteraceae bacterium]|nr:D-2-hydroxyacid dehydrogenase [Caulobacteraceae bacterium]
MSDTTLLILDRDAEIYRRAVAAAYPQVRIIATTSKDEALAAAGEADILAAVGHALDEPLGAALRGLKWVQALSTGVDGVTRIQSLPKDIILTSARGAHGPQMAEMAFAHMLSLTRQVPRFVHNQDNRRWERWPQAMLHGKTVVIVGTGFIAGELAARCKAFGLTVKGVTHTVRPVEHFDEILPRTALKAALGEADYAILLLPLDDSSRNLFDAEMIAAIKPGGFLINLARGGIVDEGALARALQSGSLAGAGLDVFAAEPLPVDSPLWATPNLLITPHVGGLSETYAQQVSPILVANLGAYLAGRPQDMINRWA